MKKLNLFLYALIAGICIGIGGVVYLSVENPVVGSLMFAVGLFAICTFGFNLFTGKVCYLYDNKPSYLLDLLIIWIGNILGTMIVGYGIRLTRAVITLRGDVTIVQKAVTMCQTKLSDNLLSIFILAIFCNFLIYIAVEGYKNNPHEIGKYLSIIFGVMVFILCGFEHCVANMFYFSVANLWSANTLFYVIIMSLGNAVGGLIIPTVNLIKNKCS